MARPTLLRHRKFRKLTRLLKSPVVALGTLEFLWAHAAEAGDDNLGAAEEVEAASHWRGKPGALVAVLVEAGFLDAGPHDTYLVHDYWHHCPRYVRQRRERRNTNEHRQFLRP